MANVNNYIKAGNAAVRKAVQIRKALSENKADYGALGEASIVAAKEQKVAAAKANAMVANASLDAAGKMEQTDILVERDKSIANSKRTARKAGMLAAGAQALGVANYLNKKKDEPNSMLSNYQSLIDKNNGLLAGADQKIADAQAVVDGFKDTQTKPTATASSSSGESNPSQSSGGSLNLTDNDFKELAYAVSSEASLGTDDEFGVAANIITRLNSGNYGSSISEIIRAPGQYEGVYKGNSKYSPEIQSRLQSPEGQAKILDFIKRLDGRTEFKGQTMLHNRVKAEDPMFDPSGNFYHYAGQ